MKQLLTLLLGLLSPALLCAQLPPPEQWVSYAEAGQPSFRLPGKPESAVLSLTLPNGAGKATGTEYRSITSPTGQALALAPDAPVSGTHLFGAAIIDCPAIAKMGEDEAVAVLRYLAQVLYSEPTAKVSNAGEGSAGSTLDRTFLFWFEEPAAQQRKYTLVRMYWEQGTGRVFAFAVDGGTADQFQEPVTSFFNQISLP